MKTSFGFWMWRLKQSFRCYSKAERAWWSFWIFTENEAILERIYLKVKA